MSAVVSTTSRVNCPCCGQQATLTVHTTYDGAQAGQRRFDFGCTRGCLVPADQLATLVKGHDVA